MAVTKPTRVEAQDQDLGAGPCRAVLVQAASEELGLRIVGQSRDVVCELEVVAANGASCAELAAANRAQAVLRVREPAAPGGAYEVVVCDAVEQTEQVRAVPMEHATGDALGASAAYEAVALVVRSALLDIASEHEARRAERAQLANEQQRARELAEREAAKREAAKHQQEARARVEADEDETAEADEGAADREPLWLILAGAEIAAIGADQLELGITGRALLALGAVQLGAGFTYGLPATLADGSAELSLSRHSAVVIASLPFRLSSHVTLDAGMHAGVAALVRSTQPRAASVTAASDATHWSALLGAEVGAALRIAGPLGARVHAALDLVPGAPRYAYEDASSTGGAPVQTELAAATYLQPRAGLTLFLNF